MNSDVRDILELEFSSKKEGNGKEKVLNLKIINFQPFYSFSFLKKKKMKRFIEPMKRPNGVNREVWRLIYKDDR
jgi:hypothetical protein